MGKLCGLFKFLTLLCLLPFCPLPKLLKSWRAPLCLSSAKEWSMKLYSDSRWVPITFCRLYTHLRDLEGAAGGGGVKGGASSFLRLSLLASTVREILRLLAQIPSVPGGGERQLGQRCP